MIFLFSYRESLTRHTKLYVVDLQINAWVFNPVYCFGKNVFRLQPKHRKGNVKNLHKLKVKDLEVRN